MPPSNSPTGLGDRGVNGLRARTAALVTLSQTAARVERRIMRHPKTRRPRASTRLAFQQLEDRTVPSGVDVVPGDPNDWPMFGHDPAGTRYNVSEHQLGPATVGGLHEVWRFRTDGPVVGTPAVVNDRVYAA